MKVLGRFERAKIQSQENCLSDNHRFTHARWGGDFDAAPVLNFFPACYLPGFILILTVPERPPALLQRGRFFRVPRVSRLFSFWRV